MTDPGRPQHGDALSRSDADVFRQLADTIQHLAWFADPDGRITWYNQRWYQYTGTTPEQMMGWGWQSVHPPETLPDVITRWQASIASGDAFEMVFPLRRHDGVLKPFLTRVEPLRDAGGAIVRWFGTNTDISQQATAEQELRASEGRLQLALDAGAIAGTWFWDVIADRFTSDRRFARCLALDEERLQAGVCMADVVPAIHPEDEPRAAELLREALARGGAYRAEYRVLQADGGYRWLEANGTVALAPDGCAQTFSGVLVDVHQRKLAELKQVALLRLGDRLRVLNRIEDIAAAAAEICGATLAPSRAGYGTVDEVKGIVTIAPDWRRDATVHSAAGMHRFQDFGSFVEELRRGETVCIADVALDHRTAGHTDAWGALGVRALLNVPLMRGGYLRGVLLLHDDVPRHWTAEDVAFAHGVADRTWAATAMAEAMAQLRALNDDLEREVRHRISDRNRIWELSQDIMLTAGFDGEITAVNPAWQHTLGWPGQELVGRSFMELVHPEDRACTAAAATALSQGGSFPSFENRYRRKDGSYRWISWSATQGDGLIVAAGRDISASKALEHTEAQLRQSQKMDAVGQLTGGVAHDFNNLLTIISTSAQLLRRPNTSPEQRARSIEAISKTVTRATRLTGQLLAFARRQNLSPTVFDASQNVMGVVEMLGTLVGARIQVQTSLEDDCIVYADPGQFDTAIVNLAVNARDAMDGAGQLVVTVRRIARMPELRAHAAVDGDFVAVSVADGGSGIPAADLEKIFEPFYTTKPVGQGTGLGLSQVFGFVKQSGGDVGVESALGRGTTFTLYFPRAQGVAPAAPTDALPAADPSTPAGGTVLIVEDNAELGSAVQAILTELGFSTLYTSDAAQALAELRRDASRFAAVFSDVVMVGMDGVALARQIRRDWPTLPVVLTSGYSHVLVAGAGQEFELVAKPYDVQTLAQALQRAIDAVGAPAAPRRPAGLSAALQSMLDEAQAETRRQAELDAMQVLDTAPETAFDDLVRMAADICGTPIGLISLIDRDRQWFKAKVGLEASETPREFAFCAHAIQLPEQVMVVEDATQDPRFAANPLVTGDPNIRFYAGAPMVSHAGYALGTLCVIAPTPRVLDPRQEELLRFLADEAVKRLELRRADLQRRAASD